jgi:hypothetical protein
MLLLVPRWARAGTAEDISNAKQAYLKEHGDRPIAAIHIDGLHKTHSVVVEQWITCEVGSPLSSCDLAEIRERIYRLAIFSRADVALVDGPAGVEIDFSFDERWTLYPVPMLWYTPGTELAGVILAEANFLGYNKGVALGGVVSNRGWYTIVGYNDPNVAFTNAWGSVHTFLGSGLVENDAPDGSIEQSFDMSRFDLEYNLGWTFWDTLSPSLTGGIRVANVHTIHVLGAEAPTDASVLIQGFALTYSDRRFRGFYDKGLRVSAEVQHAFPLTQTTSSYNVGIFDARYAHAGFFDGFWEVHGRVFLSALPIAFEERLGGLDGSRTIPGSGLVGADSYGSLSIESQVPLVSFGPATMNAVVFGEIGRYGRNDEPAVNYGGPGVGLRLFLPNVAIPAVGADLGYEVGSGRFAISVAIGYRPLR